MLSKEKRLNLKKDFSWVAAGKKIDHQLFKFFLRFGDNPQPRVGIALSKSEFKGAVDRNRARRITSVGFESWYNKLPKGINIVVMPKKGVIVLSSAKVAEFLGKILKENQLLNDEKDHNLSN